MLLNGTALVTGAGSGIGRAVALACAAGGCRAITVADKNLEGVQQTERLVKEIGNKVKILTLSIDVSEVKAVENTVLRTVEAFGSLDYGQRAVSVFVKFFKRISLFVYWLINRILQPLTLQVFVYLSSSAEVTSSFKGKISCKARVATAKYPMEEYDDIQAVNARGLALCTRAEIQAMLKQNPKVTIDSYSSLRAQRGSIVNIASTCGSNVIPDLFPYVASKHTVMGITKAAGVDHATDLVRINAVCPGLVETPMIAARRKQLQDRNQETPTTSSEAWAPANMYNTPLGRLALAEEVADTCVFLASSMSSHITASSITVDGGRTAAY
ncbi:uncharacterized protein Z518_06454 [Rhinocladiella mackenziei CBS 650.93]|uniref:Uncharacterized protein n=1 Tax=Rhinocladiella mackenziei CBS 650.93 TaxID=1442369 RepID=A0A0D2FU04_9EURO|nr:uncharacterized protein Z518_06454 [Rhinocladiella mackenziei CBS 650.93]KIX05582.1 hypothetical protein Z518_06454 [Rhinocladiella mackenziei CBS 650.93]